MFNLNRYDLIWVNYREEEEKYQFVTLHPYEFVLVRDKDTGEVLIVGLNYPDTEITQDARTTSISGEIKGGDGIADLIAENQADGAPQGETWVFWSKDQHVKIRVQQVKEMVAGSVELKTTIDFIPIEGNERNICLLYTSPSPRDRTRSRMPSSA